MTRRPSAWRASSTTRSATRSRSRSTPMVGGGSCEVFAVDRGGARWVLRRAPRHASSATAHDVLREFRILDAIKDEPVAIARPVVACDDPDVFGAPFYVMERIDGRPIRSAIPAAWASAPETHGRALEQLVDALVAIHAVDWRACGLGDLAHTDDYLARQVDRWLLAARVVRRARPARRARTSPSGSTRTGRRTSRARALPRRLQARQRALRARRATEPAGGRRLGDGRDRRPARRPRVGAHLPPRARGHDAPRHGQGADGSTSTRLPIADRARRALRHRVGPRRRAASAGTTCSPAGSWRSCSRAATPSSCAASPTSRSTSSSGARWTCCSRARPHSIDGRNHLMRAWQVQGAGEPIDVLHEVELELARARAGAGAHPRHRGRASGCPTCSCAAAPTRSRRRCRSRPGQEATGTVTAVGEGVDLAVGDRIMCVTMFWQGHGSFAEECLVAADSAFPVPDGLTDAEAAGFWIPHLTGWTGLVDRGSIVPRRLARGARRRGRQRHRGGAARHGARRAGHRGGQRRRARRVLPWPRRRSHRRTTVTARSRPTLLRARRAGRASTWSTTRSAARSAEDAAGALARDGRLLAVGFASGALARSSTRTSSSSRTVARRRVRRRVLARRARRDPRAARGARSPTAGFATP